MKETDKHKKLKRLIDIQCDRGIDIKIAISQHLQETPEDVKTSKKLFKSLDVARLRLRYLQSYKINEQ